MADHDTKEMKAQESALMDSIHRLERTSLFPEIPRGVTFFSSKLVGQHRDRVHFHFGGRRDGDIKQLYRNIATALSDIGIVAAGRNDPLPLATNGTEHASNFAIDIQENGGIAGLREKIDAAIIKHAANEELRPKFGFRAKRKNRKANEREERELKRAAKDFISAFIESTHFANESEVELRGPHVGQRLHIYGSDGIGEGSESQILALKEALETAGIQTDSHTTCVDANDNGGVVALAEKLRVGAENIRSTQQTSSTFRDRVRRQERELGTTEEVSRR